MEQKGKRRKRVNLIKVHEQFINREEEPELFEEIDEAVSQTLQQQIEHCNVCITDCLHNLDEKCIMFDQAVLSNC